MNEWEELLSDKAAEPKSEEIPPEAPAPAQDPESAESLFIVEGLGDSATLDLEVIPISTPAIPEEEHPAVEEMNPLSVDLGNAPAEEIPQAESLEEMAREGEFPEEAAEAEPAAAGIPRLYLYGSIAAGLLCLISFGAIYWKKNHKEEEPMMIASALPAKSNPKPVAVEKPAAELVEETPHSVTPVPPQAHEGDPVAVAPAEPAAEQPGEPYGPEPDSNAAPVSMAPAPAEIPAEPVALAPEAPEPEKKGPIARGHALLQLKNGNLFSGKIMKVSEAGLLMRVPEGEIYFPMEDIAQVLPPGDKDNLSNYPSGYVDLANGNRLWGRIIDQGEESVTVAAGLARIVLIRGNVVSVKLGQGVVVGK